MTLHENWEFDVIGIYNYRRGGVYKPMFDFIRDHHDGIDGDIVDVGVYKGKTTLGFAMYLKELGSDKKVYGYDSFCGFPPDPNPMDAYERYEELFEEGRISQAHWDAVRRYWETIGFLKEASNLDQFTVSTSADFSNTSQDFLERKIERLGLDNIVLVPGFFSDTMTADSGPEKIFFVNLDCDLYDGYKLSLPFVWDRMPTGGYIWLDEYYSLKFPGARIATDEFFVDKADGPEMDERLPGEFERWHVVRKS